jgi:hypothetical protein
MLTATSDGLWRGKATGNGNLIFARPDLQNGTVLVNDGNVYYSRLAPIIPSVAPFPLEDIWTVRTDGTGDRALVNDSNHNEILEGVAGPWVVYKNERYEQGINTTVDPQWSVRSDTGQRTSLFSASFYCRTVGIRAIFLEVFSYVSVNLDGSDTRVLAENIIGMCPSVVDNRIYYTTDSGTVTSLPANGGAPLALDNGLTYTSYADHIGSSIIYHRCTLSSPVGPCDVVSIHADGTNRVVLASQSANEAVQGVTTNQVIIRRNLSDNDQLVAVPVAGGPEKLLMPMTNSEFVELVTGDLIIVRKPSGTWSLDLNGALKQLGTVALDFNVTAVGNAVCGNTRNAVWCMPLDGAGPQVKIADEGKVVGVL